jgi:hypothetical protein
MRVDGDARVAAAVLGVEVSAHVVLMLMLVGLCGWLCCGGIVEMVWCGGADGGLYRGLEDVHTSCLSVILQFLGVLMLNQAHDSR